MTAITQRLSRNEIIGVILGILPFFISFSSRSSSTVNGQVVSSSYFDVFAVGCGVVALILVFVSLRDRLPKFQTDRWFSIGVLALMLILGVVQILRGVGAIGL